MGVWKNNWPTDHLTNPIRFLVRNSLTLLAVKVDSLSWKGCHLSWECWLSFFPSPQAENAPLRAYSHPRPYVLHFRPPDEKKFEKISRNTWQAGFRFCIFVVLKGQTTQHTWNQLNISSISYFSHRALRWETEHSGRVKSVSQDFFWLGYSQFVN